MLSPCGPRSAWGRSLRVLRWSDALALDLPPLDETHQEFVELRGQARCADEAARAGAWHAPVAHTQAHYDQEDRWMADTGLAAATATASSTAPCARRYLRTTMVNSADASCTAATLCGVLPSR